MLTRKNTCTQLDSTGLFLNLRVLLIVLKSKCKTKQHRQTWLSGGWKQAEKQVVYHHLRVCQQSSGRYMCNKKPGNGARLAWSALFRSSWILTARGQKEEWHQAALAGQTKPDLYWLTPARVKDNKKIYAHYWKHTNSGEKNLIQYLMWLPFLWPGKYSEQQEMLHMIWMKHTNWQGEWISICLPKKVHVMWNRRAW